MIVDLPDTSSRDISKRLVGLRHEMGAVTLGRVLTLIVEVDEKTADQALEVASEATRQSPSRILVIVRGSARRADRLDAQIRIGGDAGASEIVVMRLFGRLADQGRNVLTPLLLPDSPIVAWWPGEAPDDVARSPVGAMAQRRVTDTAKMRYPRRAIAQRSKAYSPGDTDLAWTRLTRWRGLLAAALDQAPFEPVTEAVVTGASDSASTDLLAAWLANRLRCPVRRAKTSAGEGVRSVRLCRTSGPVDLVRISAKVATLSQPGQPVRRMTLGRPSDVEVLGEEIRRLDSDEVYEQTLLKGLSTLPTQTPTMAQAVAAGHAPDVEAARKAGDAVRRASSGLSANAMVDAPTHDATKDEVKKAAERQLDARRDDNTGQTR
ncbi:glucose-6-phosphate dehydrogenase assembly protein OpcA [Demetria terragena]|uniref:glucose-6-phosphate dehydrogenase assembly protein OpcA n=1 Tax=Demetria terragena TaxID=63959 RepID=UPI000381D50E|nr:glucose-6-phosphate dehydrogenase assembly protein OpcA [Demetria terragena]